MLLNEMQSLSSFESANWRSQRSVSVSKPSASKQNESQPTDPTTKH
jgi:hypothetical protein